MHPPSGRRGSSQTREPNIRASISGSGGTTTHRPRPATPRPPNTPPITPISSPGALPTQLYGGRGPWRSHSAQRARSAGSMTPASASSSILISKATNNGGCNGLRLHLRYRSLPYVRLTFVPPKAVPSRPWSAENGREVPPIVRSVLILLIAFLLMSACGGGRTVDIDPASPDLPDFPD